MVPPTEVREIGQKYDVGIWSHVSSGRISLHMRL